jgi:hypothetical protein
MPSLVSLLVLELVDDRRPYGELQLFQERKKLFVEFRRNGRGLERLEGRPSVKQLLAVKDDWIVGMGAEEWPLQVLQLAPLCGLAA